MNSPAVKTRPPRRAPPRIARGVGKLMADLAKKTGALDPALISSWPEIVGPELNKLCRPARIKRIGKAHALVVSANSGAAAMRIQFGQREILERAKTFLRLPTLKKVIIEQRPHAQSKGQKAGSGPRSRFRTRVITAADLPEVQPCATPRRPAQSVAEALSRLEQSIADRELKQR